MVKFPNSFKDIAIGTRFGRLIIQQRSGSNKDGNALWLCICDCGNHTTTLGVSLRSGMTKSCGCLRVDAATTKGLKHGHARRGLKNSEYNTWMSMKQRCSNPKATAYEYYGGRGIKVCKEWVASFDTFLTDMGAKPTSKHSLDRINNDLDYCPSNCRWATSSEQSSNQRSVLDMEVRIHELESRIKQLEHNVAS